MFTRILVHLSNQINFSQKRLEHFLYTGQFGPGHSLHTSQPIWPTGLLVLQHDCEDYLRIVVLSSYVVHVQYIVFAAIIGTTLSYLCKLC